MAGKAVAASESAEVADGDAPAGGEAEGGIPAGPPAVGDGAEPTGGGALLAPKGGSPSMTCDFGGWECLLQAVLKRTHCASSTTTARSAKLAETVRSRREAGNFIVAVQQRSGSRPRLSKRCIKSSMIIHMYAYIAERSPLISNASCQGSVFTEFPVCR